MKKTIIVLSALLALVSCNKENPVKESAIDPSKIVFNINVENAEATKGVKTVWEDGDDVYVFFEDNTTQYVKMTYDGSSWTYKDKDGGTAFSGLTLAASGKKLSAVYMPDFVCSAAPTYATDKWTFGDVRGYYQAAEAVAYTVTSTADVNTLSATISLAAPSNISQVFIPTSQYAALGSGEEYVLTATHFIQFSFDGVAPGGAVSQGNMSNGFPLPAFAGTLGGETGLYFWGILESAGTYDFDFQLVKQNAEKKYAISSKSKSKKNMTVPARFAAKLTGLTDRGPFVDMGYGSYLWATGNLTETSPYIADPLASGDYYKWGYTTPYDKTGTTDAYDNYISNEADFADAATAKNSEWHMLTYDQFREFYQGGYENTEHSWVGNGTIFTSRRNGLSLFFAAAGYYGGSSTHEVGDQGAYWTSTHSTYFANNAYDFVCDRYNNVDLNEDQSRYCGCTIRPVWDK